MAHTLDAEALDHQPGGGTVPTSRPGRLALVAADDAGDATPIRRPRDWREAAGLMRPSLWLRPACVVATRLRQRAVHAAAPTSPTHDAPAGPAPREEIELLSALLVEADHEREGIQRAADRHIATLRDEISSLTEELLVGVEALEHLARERDGLRRTVALLHGRGVTDGDGGAGLLEPPAIALARPSSLIEHARDALEHVVIPDAARRDLVALDDDLKHRVWASEIWDALWALERYAADAPSRKRATNFHTWCRDTGEYPCNKVAVQESRSVLQDRRLVARRLLVVSEEVDPTGRILMPSHIKVQQGGGASIPRIYFHDDTHGTTRAVHIGFIGPHSLMPNTKTN